MAETETGADDEVKLKANPFVITGEVFISSVVAYALIDSRSTHSHPSLKFVRRLGRSSDQMSTPFGTILPSGEVMQSDSVLRACPIVVDNRELFVDLIVLDMDKYEIIFSMD